MDIYTFISTHLLVVVREFSMITIINGTNRTGNLSQIISAFYRDQLLDLGAQDVVYISMEDLPKDIISSMMFTVEGRSSQLTKLQNEVIIPSEKLLFILPEYNGGIPGILKLFIDACSTYKRDDCFKRKKVGMLGVASGRAGNLRGMEHLTGVMNYLGAIVMPDKLPISSINSLITDQRLTDKATINVLKAHAQSFLDF